MAEQPQQQLTKCDVADYQKEIEYLRTHLPSWKDVSSDQIMIEKFPFGHSRACFKVSAAIPNVEPNPILLRKFLNILNAVANQKESDLFQKLGDLGWGPKCYHRGDNLRIEQYFASNIITCKQINHPPLRRKLSIKLAELHKLEGLLETEKKGFFIQLLEGGLTMQMCKKNLALDIYDEEETKIVNEIKEAVSDSEVEFLKKLVSGYPLVFGHNDIWTGNILLLENKEDIVFVDYEMMDYNFAGYDLGKLILETLYDRHHANSSYKLLPFENLPTEDEMKDFVKFYLLGKYGFKPQDDISPEELLKSQFGSEAKVQKAIQSFYEEVQVGLLMSGYYSMALGMRLGKNAGFALDFFQFAKDGLEIYKEFKKRLFNK